MREAYKGQTSTTQYLVLRSSTTGLGLTGKIHSDVTGSYTRNRAARTAITMATLASASAAWSSGGFILVDDTNCPGLYRFDIPDAAFATGADKVLVSVKVTGAIEEHIEFLLTDWNKQVASIPNAAAEAAGGLFTRGTGAGQINQAANGMIDTNPVRLNNVSQSLLDLKDFADDGYDPATNKVQGVVLTDTVTTYTGNTPQTGDNFARLGAPVGASISADVAGVQSDTNDLQTRLPATLVSGRIDASVGAMATDTLTSGALAATAVTEIQAGLATAANQTTIISAVAGVLADTDDLQARLPAALVSGRIDASVGAMAADTVTAAAIATDAIGSAELAASAVTEIQSGLATAANQATILADIATVQTDTGNLQTRLPAALVSGRIDASVGAMAANTLTATAIAADAITAAKIAPDAIGASELAADAVTEIQSGLATAADLATVQADTDSIQTRLPAALVSGRIDASVGAMAANTLTATAIATDAITAAKIATDAIGAAELAADAVAEIADQVWDEVLAGHLTAGTTGNALGAAGTAGDPWSTALPGAYVAGEAGFILAGVAADTDNLQTRVPAALVGGRMDASVGAMAADTLTASAIATDAIGANELAASAVTEIQAAVAAGSVASVAGSVGSVTGNVAGSVGSLGAQAKADVNAEILDVLDVDVNTEITAIPAATATLRSMIKTVYAFCTNKLLETATVQTLRNRADSATIGAASVSDDLVTSVRGSYT